MRALCWHGKEDIRCETVPDPIIQDPRDIVIKVTSCAICGSDLHLMGAFVGKGLTMKTGQTHVQKYLDPLMKRIVDGEIDPSFLITHRVSLEDGPEAYKTFRHKKEGCIKVVMRPNG